MTDQKDTAHSARAILDKFYDEEKVFTSTPAAQQDFSPIAALFSDDYYMEQSSALPWAGTYHGPEGLKKFLQIASEWVVIDVRDRNIFQNPTIPNRIVVLSQLYYTCHKTGVRIDFPLSQTIDFDFDLERGLISNIRSYYWDIRWLNEAMGYTSPSK